MELEKRKRENKNKVRAAQDKLDSLQEAMIAVQAKHDAMVVVAQNLPQTEFDKNSKKINDGEKLIAYLRKDNEKLQEAITSTKNNLSERTLENNRLCESNAAAGVSVDNLERKNAVLSEHNVKLEANLAKWKVQNMQLKADLKNRQLYFRAETKIRAEYEHAMEKIIEILQSKCDNARLLEEVLATQASVEQFAMNNSSQPTLAGSEVSDY
jgi:hypothetical protein